MDICVLTTVGNPVTPFTTHTMDKWLTIFQNVFQKGFRQL